MRAVVAEVAAMTEELDGGGKPIRERVLAP
jgi:hypothetical protein